MRFTVAQAQSGRIARGGFCATPTKANRGAHSCTRLVALPDSFTPAAGAGANRFDFTGRLAGQKLKVGSYRLLATPTAGGKIGDTTAAAFRVMG